MGHFKLESVGQHEPESVGHDHSDWVGQYAWILQSYWHVGNSNKRRLFDKFREVEYFVNHEHYQEYFKKLVLALTTKSPLEIIDEFQPANDFPNWKRKLIKDPKYLDELSKTNYIAIAEDNSYCYLLKSMRPREIEGSLKIE